MALFCYFKKKGKSEKLPDPHGPLAQSVPSTAIAAANSEVRSTIESKNSKKKGASMENTLLSRRQWLARELLSMVL